MRIHATNNRRQWGLVCGAVLAATWAASAQADESWTTHLGTMIWEKDRGTTAILRLDDQMFNRTIRFHTPDLARDVMGGRGAYHGVWIANDGAIPCDTQMVDSDFGPSAHWGTFVLTFVNPEFPSDWAAVMGNCLETPMQPLSGRAP